MSIQLSPEMKNMVSYLVEGGQFKNEDQVIHSALLNFADREYIMKEVREAINESDAGKNVVVDNRYADRLKNRLLKKINSKKGVAIK